MLKWVYNDNLVRDWQEIASMFSLLPSHKRSTVAQLVKKATDLFFHLPNMEREAKEYDFLSNESSYILKSCIAKCILTTTIR